MGLSFHCARPFSHSHPSPVPTQPLERNRANVGIERHRVSKNGSGSRTETITPLVPFTARSGLRYWWRHARQHLFVSNADSRVAACPKRHHPGPTTDPAWQPQLPTRASRRRNGRVGKQQALPSSIQAGFARRIYPTRTGMADGTSDGSSSHDN